MTERAEKKKPGARDVALAVVRDVFGPQQRGAQAAFDYRVRVAQLDARDRAFAAELAYGAIKQRRLLDWYLEPYVGERVEQLPSTIREILRLGVYQLRMMDGVDDHAAVYETVALALRYGHRGTANLVNAVLRRLMRESGARVVPADAGDDDLGLRHSLPTWLVAQWRVRFDGRCEEICAGVNRAPRASVRVNTLRDAVADVQAVLTERGVTATPSPLVPEVLFLDRVLVDEDADQRWAVQSESSAMPVDVLAPQPGETIVELCSGRGNKSVQIAARMENRGRLEAMELDARKVQHWRTIVERAGVTCAACAIGDARDLAGDADADGVLVDAPCSGLGVVGRHPEARWRKRVDDGARLAPTQLALLEAGARRVRPGGRLVYSVCSTDPREGSEVVAQFLDAHPDFARAPVPERYAAFAHGGDVLVPPGVEGRDGFAITLLERRR